MGQALFAVQLDFGMHHVGSNLGCFFRLVLFLASCLLVPIESPLLELQLLSAGKVTQNKLPQFLVRIP